MKLSCLGHVSRDYFNDKTDISFKYKSLKSNGGLQGRVG